MPRHDVDVRLGSAAVPVGTLIMEISGQRQTSIFTYHASWRASPGAFALSPAMPLVLSPFYGRNEGNKLCLPGPIADGTPDSWGRKIFEKTKRSTSARDFDVPLGTDDVLRTGALRYFDAEGPRGKALAADPEEGRNTVPKLHDLEAVSREARAFEADPDGYASRFPNTASGAVLRHAVGALGGARPKINAIGRDGTLWIAKLPKQQDSFAMARAEALALKLANGVGIHAAKTRLLNDAHRFLILLVKRFDRAYGGETARIPFISAQTFLGLLGTRTGSYEELGMQMRTHSADPASQIRALYRRMTFGILIRNTDDHLRNHGFLYTPRGWVLSPAYDINPEHRAGGRLQTPISEIHGTECSIRAALDAAAFCDVRPKDAREMAQDIARYIAENRRLIGANLGMYAWDFNAVAAAF